MNGEAVQPYAGSQAKGPQHRLGAAPDALDGVVQKYGIGAFGYRAYHLDDCGAIAGSGLNLCTVTHDVAAAARALADITHPKFHGEALAGHEGFE